MTDNIIYIVIESKYQCDSESEVEYYTYENLCAFSTSQAAEKFIMNIEAMQEDLVLAKDLEAKDNIYKKYLESLGVPSIYIYTDVNHLDIEELQLR
jgi:hypothetical protein